MVRATARLLCVVLLLTLTATYAAAASIWNGPRITFTKLRGQDETLRQFQDRITPQVWLTRGNNRGLYNIRQEFAYVDGVSPVDTEWAYGTTADLPNLKFASWVVFHGRCPPCQVGRDAVVHLISEDIYIDIKMPELGGRQRQRHLRAVDGAGRHRHLVRRRVLPQRLQALLHDGQPGRGHGARCGEGRLDAHGSGVSRGHDAGIGNDAGVPLLQRRVRAALARTSTRPTPTNAAH